MQRSRKKTPIEKEEKEETNMENNKTEVNNDNTLSLAGDTDRDTGTLIGSSWKISKLLLILTLCFSSEYLKSASGVRARKCLLKGN
jgi:hypothetical protein